MRLIDADALKEYIHNQDGRPFIGITIGEAFQMMVDEQPTIEERNTGKWEKQRETYCSWSCSVCKEIVVAMPERMGYPLYDFCPNCGARMVVEHD